jgi:CheY-like chemotaxis protein
MLEGMKILAADDDEMSLEMLSSILASQGAVCTTVANGRLALETLEATPGFLCYAP